MAGGGQDGVDLIAIRAQEPVSTQPPVALRVADHRFDRRSSLQLPGVNGLRGHRTIKAEAAHSAMLRQQPIPGRALLEEIPDSGPMSQIELRDDLVG